MGREWRYNTLSSRNTGFQYSLRCNSPPSPFPQLVKVTLQARFVYCHALTNTERLTSQPNTHTYNVTNKWTINVGEVSIPQFRIILTRYFIRCYPL